MCGFDPRSGHFSFSHFCDPTRTSLDAQFGKRLTVADRLPRWRRPDERRRVAQVELPAFAESCPLGESQSWTKQRTLLTRLQVWETELATLRLFSIARFGTTEHPFSVATDRRTG